MGAKRKPSTSTAVKQRYITKTYQQYLYRVRKDSEQYEKMVLYTQCGGNMAALIRELVRLFFERVEIGSIPRLAEANLRPHTATKPWLSRWLDN